MADLEATPNVPNKNNPLLTRLLDVKSASPDTIIFDNDQVEIEPLTDLIFENIGGHELINIARTDTVNGQQIYYNPIKNLSEIQRQYNPKNILALQLTSDKYFENFAIKLDKTIPYKANGKNNFNVYMETETGDIVVDMVNLQNDEQVEIQIAVDGTIYEAII